jgi:cyclopropane fatty-acyl-phospholipid synthase-like methyltransferase
MNNMPEKIPSVSAYYDALAPDYNEITNAAEWPERGAKLVHKIFEITAPENINTALDLGSGTGHTIDAILEKSHPSRLVAVDASSAMLKNLKQRHSSQQIETIHSTIEEFTANCNTKFDVITAISCLEFVENLPSVIRRATELLNQGGVFAATYIPRVENGERSKMLESPYVGKPLLEHYWLPSEIEQSLTSQGLKIEHKESLVAYQRDEDTIHYEFIIAAKA